MFSTKTLQYVLIRCKGQSILDLQELMHANMDKFFQAVYPWKSWADLVRMVESFILQIFCFYYKRLAS